MLIKVPTRETIILTEQLWVRLALTNKAYVAFSKLHSHDHSHDRFSVSSHLRCVHSPRTRKLNLTRAYLHARHSCSSHDVQLIIFLPVSYNNLYNKPFRHYNWACSEHRWRFCFVLFCFWDKHEEATVHFQWIELCRFHKNILYLNFADCLDFTPSWHLYFIGPIHKCRDEYQIVFKSVLLKKVQSSPSLTMYSSLLVFISKNSDVIDVLSIRVVGHPGNRPLFPLCAVRIGLRA